MKKPLDIDGTMTLNWTLKNMLFGVETGKSDSGYREVVGYMEKRLKCGKEVNHSR